MAISITGFGGEIPRVEARLLANSAAQVARTVKLEDGSITPLRVPTLEKALASTALTIFLDGDDWLTWPAVVSVVPAPIAEDRLYVTGDGAPKVIAAGATYPLAVPAPTRALVASIQTGSPDPELSSTILYTYTWVTTLDEESEPAPLSNALLWSEGLNVVLSGFALPPAGRPIDRMRIYRSQTSALGETLLYLIKERAVSAAGFTDLAGENDIQEQLPSLDYNAPPANLSGLVPMPNGMMAAFVGKKLYFCEPYRPHAWPEKYILTMDYEIVGLGVFGSAVAVMTRGQPYIVAGTAPDTMSMEKLEVNLPCVSARGIVDLGYSIAYPSPEGLVVINTSGAQLVSRNLITRDQWQRLKPASFVASVHSGRYVTSYTPISGSPATLVIDLSGEQPFITHADAHATAMYYDIETSRLFYAEGLEILEWDALTAAPDMFTWRSKIFALAGHVNFSCFLADVEQMAGADTLSFTARIIADGRQVASVQTVNQVARLPSGFLARNWEIEVESNAKVTALALAFSPTELSA
ncbi:hypothetical protein [Sphingobium yanoikuyae]|uniref:hypothetical protein n=1 Tax=Sphingobium yanoikuyae TaxID=13690 RepID=UPI0004E42EFB|nr:hypothetical protein [Sphingobium yanoikuyae]KFD27071.1 hypothetical protein IH86_16915 [Sphingobium yanoikuyae]MDV3479882.1 hypothetical protein [Sphingobium yanoikuyae]